MDTKSANSRLGNSSQQLADILQQCKDGAFGDLSHAALALDRIEAIFAEILELQEQLAQDYRGMGQNSATPP